MKFAAIILLLVVVGIRALAASRSATNLTAQQRVETERLEAMHETRLRFARERKPLPDLGAYEDFRAVMHVHAEDSNHTKGTRQQVLEAAKKALLERARALEKLTGDEKHVVPTACAAVISSVFTVAEDQLRSRTPA